MDLLLLNEVRTPSPAGTQLTRAHALVLLALPLISLAFNGDWIYSASGTLDPWLYHGYFHRYPEFVSTLYRDTYYGTRLSWIVPGYVVYSLFPPFAANLVLHLGLYYVAVVSIYRVVSLLADGDSALLSATAFGTSWQTLTALGWDYVDGPVIAFSTLALAAALGAAKARSIWQLVLAGAAGAAMVHANLGALLLVPAVAVPYLVLRARTPLGQYLRDVTACLVGATLLTAVLAAVNAWVGGPWLFFMASVWWTMDSIGTQTFVPVPLSVWLLSPKLVLPAIGAVTAITLLVGRHSLATVVASLPMVLALTGFALFDGAAGGGLLQTDYYISWLLPPSFLAVGVAVHGLGNVRFVAGVVVGIILFNGLASTRHPSLPSLDGPWLGYLLLLTAAVVITAARARRGLAAILIALLCIPNWLVGSVAARSLQPTIRGESRDQFELIQQTLRFVSTAVPANRRPLFWIEKGPMGAFAASIASTHLYLYSLVGTEYPRLPDDARAPVRFGATLGSNSTVVILSYQPPDLETIQSEFARFRLTARVQATETLERGRVKFILTAVDVTET